MMYFAPTQFGNLVLFINCYYFKDTYFIFLFHYKDMSPDRSGNPVIAEIASQARNDRLERIAGLAPKKN